MSPMGSPPEQPDPVPNAETEIPLLVILDIEKRRDLGIQRYGTALQPYNGRDGLRDLYEEILDAAMYVRQILEEKPTPEAVARNRCLETMQRFSDQVGGRGTMVNVRQVINLLSLTWPDGNYAAPPSADE